MWDDTISEYVAFVYEQPGQNSGAGGGLGDRLGGMLTAIAYSIRTRRKLVIQADPSFIHLFRPMPASGKNATDSANWGNWDWLGWKHEFMKNMTSLNCVNPGRRSSYCALESANGYRSYKVIRYAGNRCYMCRWLKLAKDEAQRQHLKQVLSIDWDANLYEIAGCMLRLVMNPSDLLWQKVDSFLHDINISNKSLTRGHHYQIGVHFRCGDSSFDEASKHDPNPECFFNPSLPWHGTNFGDDHTMDSPIDLAKCVNQSVDYLRRKDNYHYNKLALDNSNNKHSGSSIDRFRSHSLLARDLHNSTPIPDSREVVVFVASDNIHSAMQIASNIGGQLVLLPKEACHIDIKGEGNHNCAENTLVQWFSLSLSDFLITQEMEMQSDSAYSDPIIDENEFRSRSPAPISAFSRYAVTYGLSSRLLRYGNCSVINPVSLSHYTHGNWLCVPKMFF
jgi:hypothetical protein